MSNQVYDSMWHKAQYDLERLTIIDFEHQAIDIEQEKHDAQAGVYELYLKYILIANKLEEIYDLIVQPQKRILVRKLLDACLGRVIEIKFDLVSIDTMEFSYNDEIVQKLGLTPLDMELRVPKYFRREREEELQYRKKFIEDILIRLGYLDEEEEEEKLTEIEAIKIIQTHERARQGRLRAQFMKELKMLKEKGKAEGSKEKESGLAAAMKIQSTWRGFATRKKTRRRKMEEMVLIGMIPPSVTAKSYYMEESEMMVLERYQTQKEFQTNYEKALITTKEEIQIKHASVMAEEIGDEIRVWIKDYKEKTGKIPDLPSEDHGGSRCLMSRPGTVSEHSRSSGLSSKESRRTKDKNKPAIKSGDLNIDDGIETGFKAIQSSFLPEVKAGVDEFNDAWKEKDELSNTKQMHYGEIIYAEKYMEVELEIRKVVDEMLRQELELLRTALDLQKGKKSKKSSKKARRSGKKGKKKKEKDLTPDRTTESLFEELVTNGIIKRVPDTPLKSFLGDIAYAARDGLNPAPGDIRQFIIENCILPLGSSMIRTFAPCVRSLLISGSKGCGKKTLVNAICTEVGAVLFDLTPANIVGKYPGKTGLIMLMHLISKVSRLLQPAVIFMDDAEKPFMKKVPKADKTDPKRLKKDLPKLIKNLGPEDRIIFVGTSSAPWDADQKLLQQTYNRFIYIPRPDYGALSFAWREILRGYSAVSQHFDFGAMAKVSDGYTIGSVAKCVQEVITCKRMLQLRVHPLTHAELINALSTRDPVYREEEESFIQWWAKTPLGRRKQRLLDMENETGVEKDESNGKKKK